MDTTKFHLEITNPATGKNVTPNESGAYRVALQTGDQLVVALKPVENGSLDPSKASISRGNGSLDPNTNFELHGEDLRLTLTVTADSYSIYSIKYDDEQVDFEIAQPPDKATQGAPPTVLEIQSGEFDRPFTYITLAFAVLATVGLGAMLWHFAQPITLGALEGKDNAGDTGSFGDRLAGVLQLTGLGIGAILLVFGTWLAALETRARLRNDETSNRGILEESAKLAEQLKTARGTIAILIAGVIVAVVSIAGASIATSSTNSGSDNATSTTSPTPTPTTSPSPPISTQNP